jgi:lipoprotein-anchoring transpeptidase ErfK/SrfK
MSLSKEEERNLKIAALKNKRQNKNQGFIATAIKFILAVIVLCLVGIGGYKTCGYFLNKGDSAKQTASATETVPAANAAAPAPSAAAPAPAPVKSVVAGDAKATSYSILIKKSEFKLYVLDNNESIVDSWGVALGKHQGQKKVSGDMKTPDGTFTIDEIDDASTWTHDFGDGKGVIKNAYGPWFLSLNTDGLSKGKWGGIGIHGTHDPNSIGTLASEGCIRLQNENLRKLVKYAKVGMKVTIEE